MYTFYHFALYVYINPCLMFLLSKFLILMMLKKGLACHYIVYDKRGIQQVTHVQILSLFFQSYIQILTLLSSQVNGKNKSEQSVLGYGLQKILRSHGNGERPNEKLHNSVLIYISNAESRRCYAASRLFFLHSHGFSGFFEAHKPRRSGSSLFSPLT